MLTSLIFTRVQISHHYLQREWIVRVNLPRVDCDLREAIQKSQEASLEIANPVMRILLTRTAQAA